MWLHVTKYAWV